MVVVVVVVVVVVAVVVVESVHGEGACSGFELMPCSSSAGWRTKTSEMMGRGGGDGGGGGGGDG